MPDWSPADGDDADRCGAPFEWNRAGVKKEGNCTPVMGPSGSFAMPVCPRAPGVQLPSTSGMELPVLSKRHVQLNVLRAAPPGHCGGDGRQDTNDHLAKQPADSVAGVGDGVGCCSLSKSYRVHRARPTKAIHLVFTPSSTSELPVSPGSLEYCSVRRD